MVEVFIIAIVMWWSDATQTPLENAIEVTHLHGLPLYFKTEEECFTHVNDNLEDLKTFARFQFKNESSRVKQILCVKKQTEV